jgi:hypothetical protein
MTIEQQTNQEAEAGSSEQTQQTPQEAQGQQTQQAETPKFQGLSATEFAIPEQFKNDPTFSGFKDLTEVLTTFKEIKINADAGTYGLKLPAADAEPEVQDKFWTQLGKPASPAEYGFERPENLPEGLDYSDDYTAKYAEIAHACNIPKDMAKKAFGMINDWSVEETTKAMAAEQAATVATKEQALADNLVELEKVWGGKEGSPAFSKQHEAARKALNSISDASLIAALEADPLLASNPVLLVTLARFGNMMSSDSVPTALGNTAIGKFSDSAASIEQKIEAFVASPKFQRMQSRDTPDNERKALKEEYNGYFAAQRKLLAQ